MKKTESTPNVVIDPEAFVKSIAAAFESKTLAAISNTLVPLVAKTIQPKESRMSAKPYPHPTESGVVCVPVSPDAVAIIDAQDLGSAEGHDWKIQQGEKCKK